MVNKGKKMELLKILIGKFKLKELFAIIWWTSLIIILLPNNIMDYLKILIIREKYQMYISLSFIITSAYYVINILKYVVKFLIKILFNEKKIAIKYMINEMSKDEMTLLFEAFHDKDNNEFKSCGYINFSDGRKTPLESKYIIYLASNMSSTDVLNNGFYAFAYNLQPYAREFLNKSIKENNIIITGNSIQYKLK